MGLAKQQEMEATMTNIYNQLARSGLLLSDLSNRILSGKPPCIEEIVMALVIGSMDCDALTKSGDSDDWNIRRISRQLLTIAFLSALAIDCCHDTDGSTSTTIDPQLI